MALFTCTECERSFNTNHPLHRISSKKGLCGFCCKDKEPERSYLVTEGVGSGKSYVSWVKRGNIDPECFGSNRAINRHINFTQRFQRIGQKKR